jgi:hypothetical protein
MNLRSVYRHPLSSMGSEREILKGRARTIKNLNLMSKQQIIKIVISVLIAALTALGAAFGLTSCNVTRTITTRSEAWQKGDTSVIIQTKTVESYDGSRKY